jgi:CubicO group peptidase (beta-lactamase class C family)
MKISVHCILGISIIFVLFSCSKNQEKAHNNLSTLEVKLTKVDSICQSFIEEGNTVGLSVALALKGEPIFSKGYGLANIASKVPATENTIYAIASVSKFITAIATMKMVEENKLSLQDKVIDYFSDFPEQKSMNEITIEHLLRHQSGLVDHENWFDSIYINERRVFTQVEFFEFIDQPLFFTPGSHYSYSNSGYAILSYILEKVSGLSFHEFIIETIGQPLDMKTLGMWPKMWDNTNATMGYELKDGTIDTSFHMMTKGMKGDGGLSASVTDLLKLVKGITEDGFISAASMDKIVSPSTIGPISIDYGLGVKFGKINGHKTWGHSGGYQGTGWAMVSHYPESGFTFTAAINTSFSPDEAWMLRHKIMPILLDLKPLKPDTSILLDLDLYVGDYQSINRWAEAKPSVRSIKNRDGKLIRDNPATEAPGTALFPIGNHSFSWEPFPYDEFKFHLVDGKIIACSEYIDGHFISLRMKQ